MRRENRGERREEIGKRSGISRENAECSDDNSGLAVSSVGYYRVFVQIGEDNAKKAGFCVYYRV
jgi:hypothetical protein